jgi:hypothetical protein
LTGFIRLQILHHAALGKQGLTRAKLRVREFSGEATKHWGWLPVPAHEQ